MKDIWWSGSAAACLIKGSLLTRPSCFSYKRCHTHRLLSSWDILTIHISAGKATWWAENNVGDSWSLLTTSCSGYWTDKQEVKNSWTWCSPMWRRSLSWRNMDLKGGLVSEERIGWMTVPRGLLSEGLCPPGGQSQVVSPRGTSWDQFSSISLWMTQTVRLNVLSVSLLMTPRWVTQLTQ